ncbi:hypothetical protein FRC07_014234 [Ceratobasidium sp. 392]|nr:hypothetical protein FRC07_014234 [Ceratobasidium sp. 392]
MAAAASLTPRPKRSVTIQRLGMQTPSPPRAVQYMATRGGGRFNIMNLPEFHRPAEKRLAVQYTEGEGDVAAVIPKPMHKEYYTRQLFNTNLAPERLSTFKRLVVERTRYLESMDPLKLAVHNNLARIITASRRLQIRTPSVVETSKPISSQRMRRMNSSLAPIDTDAARAYISTGPVTDSPMDSPGPVTPVDETTQISRGSQMERGKTSRTKASKKGGVHQVHSKVKAKARMSRPQLYQTLHLRVKN